MKRLILILVILCSSQFAFGQKTEEEKPKKQESSNEKKDPLIIQATHDVTIKLEEEKKGKKQKEIPIGKVFDHSVEIKDPVDEIFLYEIKSKYTKDIYNLDLTLDFTDSQSNEYIKKERLLKIEKQEAFHYFFKVPTLRVNRYYYIVSKYYGHDLLKIFEAMRDEGLNEGYIKTSWMRMMMELSEKRKPFYLYYYPLVNELVVFKDLVSKSKIDLTLDNAQISDSDKDELKRLTEFAFPIIKYNPPSIDLIVRFAKWAKKKSDFGIDDTWYFSNPEIGLGKHYDFLGLYNFYKKHIEKGFPVKTIDYSDKDQIDKIIKSINDKIQDEIEYFDSISNYHPNYLRDIETIVSAAENFKTFPLTFEKSFKRSLVPDFGLLVNRFPGNEYRGLPFVGVHIPFEPVNKDVTMAESRLSFGQRTSLHVGITLSSIAEDNVRDDLFSNYSLILGFGRKIIHHALRLNAGAVAYNKIDAINGNKSFALSPYLGLSIDIEIRKWLEKTIPSFTGNFKKSE
ncbi:hypothetical protein [uncultured Allomuricauda sp.]|uniref:hypothetical protein n=1 Tax=Flagellimonas sp. W118 TaxID=3410791 RepID=UPI00262BA46A|nr:hypothetical protein [uncultured Allomuricauda sp.]